MALEAGSRQQLGSGNDGPASAAAAHSLCGCCVVLTTASNRQQATAQVFQLHMAINESNSETYAGIRSDLYRSKRAI
jgi:hypothetical protein